MPTNIFFGTQGKITVEEEPSQVLAELTAAAGMPFPLTRKGKQVYVNPARIDYWETPGTPQVRSLG